MKPAFRIATTLSVSLVLLLIGGCRTSVPDSDPARASELLNQALENWKAGVSVSDLRVSNPPIYVAEDMWNPTFRLTAFTIDSQAESYGSNVRFRVTLEGAGSGKPPVTVKACYLVTTTPALTIAREDR